MLKILFIGDVCGRIGRQAVIKLLPQIKKEEKVDFVIANAENSAHGSGITENIIKELMEYGVDYMTMGDHAFKNTKNLNVYEKYPIIGPANFSENIPSEGYKIIEINNKKILLINLIGRVFMKMDYDCPFRKIDEILGKFHLQTKSLSAIIIDIHAEATSEKVSLGHYLNGKVSALLGTHTHVMTADEKITKEGMAYITDVGMTGAADECIGVDKENIIKTYLTQISYPHVIPEKGRAIFNSVLLEINDKDRRAKKIKPITRYVNIK